MLDEILGRARRRLIAHRLLADFTLGAAVFTGGLVLLLVVGTGVLEWWAPPLLAAALLAAALMRLALSPPTRGTVAALIDQHCALSDALGTAVHFEHIPGPVVAAQRRYAEAAATRVDLAKALPLRAPRAAYALGALALSATGLLLIRFGASQPLPFRAPIANIAVPAFLAGGDSPQNVPLNPVPRAKADPSLADPSVTRLGSSTSDDPASKDIATPPGSAVTAGAAAQNPESGAAALGKKPTGAGGDQSNAGDASAGSPQQNGQQPPSSHEGAPQSAQSGNKHAGDPDSSGMMNKLRDAVSGLLSKMKPQSGPQSPSGMQKGQQASGKQPSGQAGAPKAGPPDPKGNPSGQDEGQEAAADSEQMTPGKGAGKSNDANVAAKPGSGMGRQDGSKELRDAQQLDAMGKLTEIIGRRSASITGEMTIEPQGGPQRLRTGYTHSSARHGEAAGDVNRDEVPLEMQSYVQQYFDQVRAKPAGKAPRLRN